MATESAEAPRKRRPLDAGAKRNLMILAAVMALGLGIIGLFMLWTSSHSRVPAPSNLGKVVPSGDGTAPTISPAARDRLNRVETAEAAAARRAGQAYIPDNTLGRGQPVNTPAPAAYHPPAPSRPQGQPPVASYQQYQQNQQRVTGQQKALGEYEDGVKRQMEEMLAALKPATAEDVTMLSKDQKAAFGEEAEGKGKVATGGARGYGATAATQATTGVRKRTLIAGNAILPATLTTPVDSYKTKFALASLQGVQGAPAEGYLMRGAVVPMTMSGDVEDVGVHFSSMTIQVDGQPMTCKVDATALNEKDATDAMNGDVDHRVFSRYVMPILMAGLSGASTFFTARGTPATSVATGTGTTTSAVIVNQAAASGQQAVDQGIGEAFSKGVQVGSQQVSKEANRPNRVTLDANTPIGVIFNAPVMVPCS